VQWNLIIFQFFRKIIIKNMHTLITCIKAAAFVIDHIIAAAIPNHFKGSKIIATLANAICFVPLVNSDTVIHLFSLITIQVGDITNEVIKTN
jgi:hypothetical protein